MEDFEYKKTNKEKKLTPKRVSFWCFSCDMQVVFLGSKCSSCGTQTPHNNIKKEVV